MKNAAHMHGMGGMGGRKNKDAESRCQAYQGAMSALNQDIQGAESGNQGDLAQALHLTQDSYSSAHNYNLWNGNQLTHELGGGDLWHHGAAEAASANLLEALEGKQSLQSPASYSASSPAGCN